MATTAKVSITLPKEILRKVARLQKQTGATRSAVVSRAISRLLREQDEQGRRRAYLEGYAKHPETARDVDEAESLAAQALADEPWE